MSEVADVYRPSALEIAAGLLLGSDPTAGPLPRPTHLSARAELERSILTALQRPPCIVAFSGGRDSSAMLALAASVARREQLPPPIAVTNRFPGVVEADETTWQERVIAYLGIQDWQRLEFADELDYVGPVAQDVLRRHGVMCPMNAYVHVPLLAVAGAGSLVDGVDGDSIFSWSYQRLADTVRLQRRPGRGAARDLIYLLSPPGAKHRRIAKSPLVLPWMTPAAHTQLNELIAADVAAEPVTYPGQLAWYSTSRHFGALDWTVSTLAAETGTLVVRPLADRCFLPALARDFGRFGFRGRTDALRRLFGDLLPVDVIGRATKARFPQYWGAASARLAADWDGAGLDPLLVDSQALRRAWSATPYVDHRSAMLLQKVWLDNAGKKL